MKEPKFKVGDRVIRIAAPFGNLKQGDIRVINEIDDSGIRFENDNKSYVASAFELYKAIDLINDRWFIVVENPADSAAIQEWLFTKGLTWKGFGTHVNPEFYKVITNGKADGTGYLMHDHAYPDTIQRYRDEDRYELNATFKTVVNMVHIPDLLTEKELKIRELERSMVDIQRQIQELRSA